MAFKPPWMPGSGGLANYYLRTQEDIKEKADRNNAAKGRASYGKSSGGGGHGAVYALNNLANQAKAIVRSQPRRVKIPESLPFAGLAKTAVEFTQQQQQHPSKFIRPDFNTGPLFSMQQNYQRGRVNVKSYKNQLSDLQKEQQKWLDDKKKREEKGKLFKIPGREGIKEVYIPSGAETRKLDEQRDALKDFTKERSLKAYGAIASGNKLLIERAAQDEALFNNEAVPGSSVYLNAVEQVNNVLSGKYAYGVTQKDYDAWYKKNSYITKVKDDKTGKVKEVQCLKFNAEAPPVGQDAEGNTIDLKPYWDYYNRVNYYKNLHEGRVKQAQEKKAALYANHADEAIDTYNSNADAIIGVIAGEGFEGFKKYWSSYILKPLKAGEFGALGLNILNDLGETLDLVTRGTKSMFASNDAVYGDNGILSKKDGTSFTGQKSWVFSGGKKIQAKLIKLGALDLVRRGRGKQTMSSAIRDRIEEAGLTKEFAQFEQEYEEKYRSGNWEDKALALKDAYTTHKNYDADTGNLAADLTLELATDPTLVIGGGAKVGVSTVTKGTAKGAIEAGLGEVGKNADEVMGLADKVTKQYIRIIGDKMLSKGSNEMEASVNSLAKNFISKGILDEHTGKQFQNTVLKGLHKEADDKAFKLIRGLHYMDSAMDTVDSALLKTVFAAPYAAFKIPQGVAKIARKGTLQSKFYRKQAMRRVTEGIVDPSTGGIRTMDVPEFLDRMNQEHLMDYDDEFMQECYQKVKTPIDNDVYELDRIVMQGQDTKLLEEVEQEMNAYISQATRGAYTSVDEYMNYLDEMDYKFPGQFEDAVTTFKKQYEKIEKYRDLTEKQFDITKKANAVATDLKSKLPVAEDAKVVDKGIKFGGAAFKNKELETEFKMSRSTWEQNSDVFMDAKYTECLNTLFNARRKPTIGETQSSLRSALRNLSDKILLNESSDVEKELYGQMRGFYNKLTESELSFDADAHMEYTRFQYDKYAVFEKYAYNPTFEKVLSSVLDIKNPLGRFIKDSVQKAKTASDNLAAKSAKELYDQAKSYQTFLSLRKKLGSKIGPLNEREMWAVLDSLFNKTGIRPEKLQGVRTTEMNNLIDKVNLHLDAMYGSTKLSLDAFRKEASDFESKLYKRFGDEIKEPKIQMRIGEILSGGHEDPLDDVRTQMLQVILRDPDSIAHYNKLFQQQDVVFTDIETWGFNANLHEITSIATKKWQELPENATLGDILMMLEKQDTNKIYQTYLPEEILHANVTDKILEVNYKNNPKISASRSARLHEYVKRFGAEANGKEITEKQMLSEFVKDLDTSYINHGESVPIIVTHNNNGFDMDFITRRLQNPAVREFPVHINRLDDVIDSGENTLLQLKDLENDVVLTKDAEDYIRDNVMEYARELAKYSDNLQVLEPGYMIQSVKNLRDVFTENGDINLAAQLDGFIEELDEVQKGMLKSINQTKNVIAENPFKIHIENLESGEWGKYFDEKELPQIKAAIEHSDQAALREFTAKFQRVFLERNHNYTPKQKDSLMRMIKELWPEDNIPRFGYKKAFVTDDASQFFDVVNLRIPLDAASKMQGFTKNCFTIVDKRLKSSKLLQGKLEDFQHVIRFCRDMALQLEPYDDLYFLRYMKAPETLNEAYVAAQKVWDLIVQGIQYDEALEFVGKNVNIEAIPKELQGAVLTLRRFGADFDIKAQVSPETAALLDNKDGLYHHQIYNDVANPDLAARYLEDISKDEADLRAMLLDMKQGDETFDTMSIWYDSSPYSAAKDLMISNILHKNTDAIEYFSKLSKDAQIEFLKQQKLVHNNQRKLFTAQILDYVLTSEDALLSHLLFHNQLLVVPKAGDTLHQAQIEKLMEILSGDNKYIHAYTHGDYVCVGIKKEWSDKLMVKGDSRYVDEEAKMYFQGEAEVYIAPTYQRIPLDESMISDPVLAKILKATDDQILRLSSGASAGSLNCLHTMKKQKELYKNLPNAFTDYILDVDYTCNERFWHNANFDMSLLGDADNCWKVGCQNDSDLLLNTRQVAREAAYKAEAQKIFIDGFFGAQEKMGIREVFPSGTSDREIAKAMQSYRENVCIILDPAKTEFGFRVKELSIKDATSVALAAERNAIVVPYDVYVSLYEQLNMSQVNNFFLKAWTRVLHFYKVGYLFSPGTWLRNYIDATIKSIGDTGAPVQLLTNQVKAVPLLQSYKRTSEVIERMRGVNHRTPVDLERIWPDLMRSDKVKLTYDQFIFMDSWMKTSISGGESEMLKAVTERSQKRVNINQALRAGRDGVDLIASDAVKFESLPADEVEKLFEKADIQEVSDMTQDEFMAIFTKAIEPDNSRYLEYNRVMDEIIAYRAKKLTSGWAKIGNGYQALTNKMLAPMSAVEEVIRLAEYLTLEEQGFTNSQIFKKITDSQFNYDIKSNATKYIEMVIPFYSFMSENMIYWCKQVSENPRMLRMLEHIWGELSWDFTENTPEDIVSNYSVQYAMLSGNIPLGNSGMFFKANPSFMDAFKLIYNGPTKLLESIWSPLQLGAKFGLAQAGADARSIFDKSVFWEDADEKDRSLFMKSISATPVVGTLADRYYYKGKKLRKRLDEGWQKALVNIFPDVFGVTARYKQNAYDSFAEFQAALERQGKWYNQNTCKVENLSTFNTEGLNALYGTQSWEELTRNKAVYQGMFWDSNQNKFVPIEEFTPGGLNREFDFKNNEGDWDEFLRLKKLYQGVVWDNNLRKFVKPGELTKGMLNKENLSWEEVQYYNKKLFGTVWDGNQGKFVDKKDFISGGLNQEHLSWHDLTALKYALHGEKWNRSSHSWVKVREPLVRVQKEQVEKFTEAAIVTREDTDTFLEKLGIVSSVYAEEATTKSYSVKEYLKDNRTGGLVLTGDPKHNAEVFDKILNKMNLGDSGRLNYSSGWAGGYKFFKRSATPRYRSFRNYSRKSFSGSPQTRIVQTEPYRFAHTAQQGIRSGGKIYGKTYESTGNLSGLRMATSSYPAYDDYYQKEFTFTYKYRNPQKGVADYPQTKLGIQRYSRMRTDALTKELRLRQEYRIANISSVRKVGMKSRLNQLKLHWWNR